MQTAFHSAVALAARATPFARSQHVLKETGPAGFAAETHVMTDQGAQPVSALLAGDRVYDTMGHAHELRALTANTLSHCVAIRIAPGALGTDWDLGELLVGSGQLLALSNWRTRILGVGSALLPAAKLTEELGVSSVTLPRLTLYTLHFDRFATIRTNGIEAGVAPLDALPEQAGTLH